MKPLGDISDSLDRGLDKIDLRILRVLQQDGRISNLKLAEEVHLVRIHPPATDQLVSHHNPGTTPVAAS